MSLQTYELGASIVHRVNEYVLGLARQMNLTVQPADDSGEAAFNIWDGSNFVFSQVRATYRLCQLALAA